MKESTSAVALCESDGRVIAGNSNLARLFGQTDFTEVDGASVAELARHLNCAGMWEQFSKFVASDQVEEPVFLILEGCHQRMLLRRLDGLEDRRMVLVEFSAANGHHEQAMLSEVGRMTSRLIHDFKNQMGGLKLYAAFLKKRFADQPEGLEISEKIINGLNVMSEHASLVTKLTRPLTLNFEATGLAPLISQVAGDLRSQAEMRGVKIVLDLPPGLPPLLLDPQQLRAALYTLTTRAINASPEGGQVRVSLRREGEELRLEIIDPGEALDAGRLATFFDFLSHDRINETSLSLALAKRIIEQHGGLAEAEAAPETGTSVRVRLPVRQIS